MPTLTTEAWGQIRLAYEHSSQTVEDICADFGISPGTLRDRMRRWNWTRRSASVPVVGPPAAASLSLASPRHVETDGRGRPLVRGEVDAAFASGEERPGRQNNGAKNAFDALSAPTPALPTQECGGGSHSADDAAIPPAAEKTAIPSLHASVARVTATIDAITARLSAAASTREIVEIGRALSALTRNLNELRALARDEAKDNDKDDDKAEDDDDPVPKDPDEFRFELARRIEAFVREGQAEDAAQARDTHFDGRPRADADS